MKSVITNDLIKAGAVAVGCAPAAPVSDDVWQTFADWLAAGHNGELLYMSNHLHIRRDPRELLPGAKTIISVAWPYLPSTLRNPTEPVIARYAYSPDYHKSIRRILKPVLHRWEIEYGLTSRVCVDSAPILERYWAMRSGVGFLGRNGCLIVPGHGSWVFLSEILIDWELEADSPMGQTCAECGVCVKICPTGALGEDGHVDCRKCLSALTLETPGKAPVGLGTLAGCDRCQEVCPHNQGVSPSQIPEFATVPAVFSLTDEELKSMTEANFDIRFAGTSLKRPGLSGLLANLAKHKV